MSPVRTIGRTFLFGILVTLGAVGGLLVGVTPYLGWPLLAIGVAASVASYHSTASRQASQDESVNLLSRLLAEKGVVNVWYERARTRLRSGAHLSQVESDLRIAVATDPQNVGAISTLAYLLVIERIAFIRWQGGVRPPDYPALVAQGRHLCARGLQLSPNDAQLLYIAGCCEDYAEEHAEARRIFMRGKSVFASAVWDCLIAESYLVASRFDEAAHALEKATRTGFDGWRIDRVRSKIEASRAHYAEAERLLRRAEMRRGTWFHEDATELVRLVSVQNRWLASIGEVLRSLPFLIRISPRTAIKEIRGAVALALIGALYSVNIKLWQATKKVGWTRRLHLRYWPPDLIPAERANACMSGERYEEALYHLYRARRLVPSITDTLLKLAMCEELVGRHERAMSLVEEARARNPEDREVQREYEHLANGEITRESIQIEWVVGKRS